MTGTPARAGTGAAALRGGHAAGGPVCLTWVDREQGFLRLVADRRRDVLLGAHAAGESAVEVVQG